MKWLYTSALSLLELSLHLCHPIRSKARGSTGRGGFHITFVTCLVGVFARLAAFPRFRFNLWLAPWEISVGWDWSIVITLVKTLVSGLANHNKRRKENEPIRSRRENTLPKLSAGKADVCYTKSSWFSQLKNLHLTGWKTPLPGNSTLRDLVKQLV